MASVNASDTSYVAPGPLGPAPDTAFTHSEARRPAEQTPPTVLCFSHLMVFGVREAMSSNSSSSRATAEQQHSEKTKYDGKKRRKRGEYISTAVPFTIQDNTPTYVTKAHTPTHESTPGASTFMSPSEARSRKYSRIK